MSDSREKWLESKYFLERMIEMQSDRNAFIYNLSAFLTAARSVTWIMQGEFDKVSGFKEWYAEKQAKMKSDDVMGLLNNKRVMTVHNQPVQPNAHVNVSVGGGHVTPGGSLSMVIIRADGNVERRESEPTPLPTPAKTEAITQWRWYFDELPEKDVITICEEHTVKLDTLVAECESRFTS